jgi:predicted transcriptional regulator
VCSQTPISAVLSHNAVSVGPGTSVERLTEVLLERGLSAATVVDESGALVGLVSTADLLREVQDRDDVEERIPLRQTDRQGVQVELGDGFHSTSLARSTVEEIMSRSKLILPETAPVARAAALMAFEGVSHLPVACSRCKGVCLVTALDVMGWLAQQSGYVMWPAVDPRREVRAVIADQ